MCLTLLLQTLTLLNINLTAKDRVTERETPFHFNVRLVNVRLKVRGSGVRSRWKSQQHLGPDSIRSALAEICLADVLTVWEEELRRAVKSTSCSGIILPCLHGVALR